MSWAFFEDHLILFIGIGLGTWPLIDALRHKSTIKTIGLFLAIGVFTWLVFNQDHRNKAEKKDSDNTINKLRDELGSTRSKLDSANDKLDSLGFGSKSANDKLDSLAKAARQSHNVKLFSFLQLSALEDNPRAFESKNKDSIQYNLYLTNFGNDAAKNLVDRVFLLCYDDDKENLGYFFDSKNYHASNKFISIPADKGMWVGFEETFWGPQKKVLMSNQFNKFIYFKISYTNSAGMAMEPFRRIFHLNGLEIYEVDSKSYEMVIKDLMAKNIY